MIGSNSSVLVVNPSMPVHTVPEFIAYAKANPGKISMASPGVGSANHGVRRPEVFLIEGHTDAVGSEIDKLSLSDRRAESVALVLSQQFGVPAGPVPEVARRRAAPVPHGTQTAESVVAGRMGQWRAVRAAAVAQSDEVVARQDRRRHVDLAAARLAEVAAAPGCCGGGGGGCT
jgi:hypothetical protein